MENNIWWTGVVEDRDDPEKLGRCRVRIFGYHTEDTNVLPVSDLPWAIPMQPITSAANSGVGTTPIGLLQGSWVVGFFLDGASAQQPVIMGSIAGKPLVNKETETKLKQRKEENTYLRNREGDIVYNELGNPIPRKDIVQDLKEGFYPITKTDFDLLLRSISLELSGNDFKKIGPNNELGKYQIDVLTLVNLGYLIRPPGGIFENSLPDNPENWSGKGTIRSKDIFLSNPQIQDAVMLESTKRNYDVLVKLGKITDSAPPKVAAALLGTSHIVGPINSDKLDKKTINGQKVRNYFVAFNTAVGGNDLNYITQIQEESNYLPLVDSKFVAGDLNNDSLSKVKGFSDPNKKYPKFEYANYSDVNKLALGDTSHIMFKVKDNNRITKIPIAKTKFTWNEPESPFAGAYPNNQVIETEAGHVVEFDNTPNAERIHVYHKKGTYIEIDVNGSMVRKIVGDNYEVMDRNNYLYVKGAHNLTVEGKTNILVQNDAAIQVDGDLSVTSHGDTLVQSAGTIATVSTKALISAKSSIDMVTDGSLKIQARDIILEAKGGDVGIKASKDVALNSGKANKISLQGGTSINLNAGVIRNRMGATSLVGLGLATVEVPEAKRIDKSSIAPLQRTVAREEYFLFDSGETGSEDFRENLLNDGNISDLIVPANTGRNEPIYRESKITPIQTTAKELDQFTTFPRSFRISKYFTLSDLLVGNQGVTLVAQGGLSERQIVANLKNLAVNCLDPIREKYKDMIITSGFRSPFVGSDHNIGSAADLMFTRTNFSQYKNIIDWIASAIPYRQLLLEYRFNTTDDAPVATWIHISLLLANGRIVPSSRSATGTFKNHAMFIKDKFVNLA